MKRHAPTIDDIPQMAAILLSRECSNQDTALQATKAFRRLLSVKRALPAKEVVTSGVLPCFVRNLSCDSQDWNLAFESAWALTNVASTNYANNVAQAGAIQPLIQLLTHGKPCVREQAAWCLGNIAGDSTDLRDQVLNAGAMPPL